MPAENPKKAGHTFLGWAKSPNATASDFDNNTTVNGDMKVYAVWKKNLNEVPLNASGNVYAKLDSAKNVNISAKNTSGDMKIEYFKWRAMKKEFGGEEMAYGPSWEGADVKDINFQTEGIYLPSKIGRASCRERV